MKANFSRMLPSANRLMLTSWIPQQLGLRPPCSL